MNDENQAVPTAIAWATLWHPTGCQVKVPLGDGVWDYKDIFANVGNAIAAGFLVDQPESRKVHDAKVAEALGGTRPQQEVGGILLIEVKGKYGPSYRAFFYSANPAVKHKVADKYLNNKADFDEFHQHTGIDVKTAPIFEGTAAVERGKSPRADAKIIPVNPPIWITVGPNPKYDPAEEKRVRGWDEETKTYTKPDEKYMVAKRVFSHWGGGEGLQGYQPGDGDGGGHEGEQSLTAYDVALQKMENASTMADVDGVNAYIKSQWAKIDKASQDDLRQRRDALVERIKNNADIPF